MFFIGISAFCFNVSAAQTITLSAVNSEVDDNAEAQIGQYLTPPSDYYVKFLISLNGLTEQRYLVIYFKDYTTFTIPTSGTVGVSSLSPATSYQRSYCYRNNPNMAWSGGYYINYWTNSGTIYSPYSNGETWQIVDYTVPISYMGSVLEPEHYEDNVFARKNGNSIEFGVGATWNSEYNVSFYQTQEYWLELKMYLNGSYSVDLTPQSLVYYLPAFEYTEHESTDEDVPNLILYQDKPKFTYWNKMRGYKVWKFEYPVDNPPSEFQAPQSNWVNFDSKNVVTLNQLYEQYKNRYDSNAVVNDMLTSYEFSFYVGNKKVKTIEVDYTPIAGSAAITELPPDEAGTPDQYDPYADLNDHLSTNNYYLQSIAYGDTYLSNGMSELLENIDPSDLNPFAVPDFELTDPDFDDDTMSWFARVVEWWYSSPFGFIAIAALTFLLIRAIVW